MSFELKIKQKHLAQEIRIIGHEITKTGKAISKLARANREVDGQVAKLSSLQHHSLMYPKIEARATHLARAYINGKKYSEVEDSTKRKPSKEWYFNSKVIPKVKEMVRKYADHSKTRISVDEWLKN